MTNDKPDDLMYAPIRKHFTPDANYGEWLERYLKIEARLKETNPGYAVFFFESPHSGKELRGLYEATDDFRRATRTKELIAKRREFMEDLSAGRQGGAL